MEHATFFPRITEEILPKSEGVLHKRTHTDHEGNRACATSQAGGFGVDED
jgi:hypothetical protein